MKVKQIKMRLGLSPTRPHLETVVAINYDNTDRRTENYHRPIPEKRFYVNLPQIVADALGYTTSRGNDQAEAFEAFEEDLERFKKLDTEVNRVILYKFEAEPLPEDHPGRKGYQSLRVVVWAGTYEETVCIAGDGARRYSYEHIEGDLAYPGQDFYTSGRLSNGDRFERQLPWTEQNEAFFQWILTHMLELVNALASLCEPDKLIESINAGRLLPLGGSA